MSAQLKPIPAILAFAGAREVQYEQAFAALTQTLVYILKDGNKRNLNDTIEVLTSLASIEGQLEGSKPQRKLAAAQAARVLTVMQGAYTAAVAQHAAQPMAKPDAEVRAAELSLIASEAFDSECTRAGLAADKASEERKEKAAATKAAKEKAAKAAEKAAKAAAQPIPLTLADAFAFIRAALASGNIDAGLQLDALVSEFYADVTPQADVIDVQAREVSQSAALALTH